MDMKSVGSQISLLRKRKGLTQSELGERLGISFQAVSKWERGETLPDTAILLHLAEVLETTVDFILSGGRTLRHFKGRISTAQMADGIRTLKQMGESLGRDNLLYRHAVNGINEGMNTNIEEAFTDDRIFECFVAEAIIQNLMEGRYIDPTDVKTSFQYDTFRDAVLDCCARYGIR